MYAALDHPVVQLKGARKKLKIGVIGRITVIDCVEVFLSVAQCEGVVALIVYILCQLV